MSVNHRFKSILHSIVLTLSLWLLLSTLTLAQGSGRQSIPPLSNTNITYNQTIDSPTVNSRTFAAHANQADLLDQTFSVQVTQFPLTHTITLTASGAKAVAAADVDSDGDVDILSASYNDNKIAWYENQGSGTTFITHTVDTDAHAARAVTVGDINGDGALDILSATFFGNKIIWYENDGQANPTFTAHTVDATANFAHSVAVADVDGDGDLDILSAAWHIAKITWYENDGQANPTFTTHTIDSTASGAASVGTADLDGDGDLDIFAAAWDINKIGWYENDGQTDPTFSAHTVTTSAVGAVSVVGADVDNDGDIDLLSASSGDNTIAWYENDGQSQPNFTPHIISNSAETAETVQVADVDGDGDLDVLSASSVDDKIAWYENDGQTNPSFITHIVTTAADQAISVAAADVDGDGDLDLLSASSTDNKIAWYENVALPPVSYTLSLTTAGDGQGYVMLNPASGVYTENTVVTLTAVVTTGYFNGWDGDANGTLTQTTVTMNRDKTVTATFLLEPPALYTLTMNVVGSGVVTPTTGTHNYLADTVVSLSATPDNGWQFEGWSGDAFGSAAFLLLIDKSKAITATFRQIDYTVYLPMILK